MPNRRAPGPLAGRLKRLGPGTESVKTRLDPYAGRMAASEERMHEYALADAVITTALTAAEKEGMRRILRIDVRVGELQRISRELFEFALKEVMPGAEPRLAETELTLEIEPARFRCRPCGRTFGLADTPGPQDKEESEAIHFIPELAHAYLRCPGCDSPDFELTAGRGVSIGAIEGETE